VAVGRTQPLPPPLLLQASPTTLMSSAAAAAAAPPPAPIKHRVKDEHVKHPRRRTESRLLLPSEGAPETRKGRGQAGTGGGH